MKPEVEQQLRQFQALLSGGMPVTEMRAIMEKNAVPAPDDVSIEQVDAGGVPAEWVVAPGAGDAVVLYVHGGGYVIGSPATHREMIARISRAAGARVLSLNYRLAPEHNFPAPVDDATAAYRWLLAQGVAPSLIAIAGDSAGGGLTLATLVAIREAGLPMPAAGVPLSAWADLAHTGESHVSKAELDPIVNTIMLNFMSESYLAGADSKHPLASPFYADLHGLPPLLMQVGSHEVLLDDTLRVAEKAKAAGVDVTVEVYEGQPHVFQQFAAIDEDAQRAIEQIGAFVRERTSVAQAAV